jgi:hypothetical protein
MSQSRHRSMHYLQPLNDLALRLRWHHCAKQRVREAACADPFGGFFNHRVYWMMAHRITRLRHRRQPAKTRETKSFL